MLTISVKFCFKFSIIISSIVSIVIAYVALDHNPMGEYCIPISDIKCDIVWSNILPLISIWFLLLFTILMILTNFIRFIQKKYSKE